MKKALLCGLSAVVLLSLTACGTAQANQPDEPPPTPTPSAVQTEPPQETPAVTPAPENAVEPLSAIQELTDEELVKEFEGAYEAGKACIELGLDEETAISLELTDLNSRFDFRSDIKKPDNLEAQYRAWRAEHHPGAPAQAETQLFVDCNETVYATGQVNIRSSYSTDSTKLGSLVAGQSITRIGTAIPGTEAEGWSRVQLSDGTIAYMVSSYLSTSKPQQAKPSGGSTQQQQPTGGSTTQTPGGNNNTTPGGNNTTPGGISDDFYNSHSGKDTSTSPVFKPLDDPWAGQAELDLGD